MTKVTAMNNKFLSLSCGFMVVLILVFGLWPFKLNPANRVFWLPEGPGVRFDGPGQLYTAGDLTAAFSARTVTIELALRPAAEPNNRLPHILSFWDGRRQEVFLLGQWKDGLAVRVRTARPEVPRGYRERGKGHILKKNDPVSITLTSSPEGTALYVNGTRSAEWPGFPLLEDGPAGPTALILGNAAVGHSPWEGELTGLAVLNRVLTEREVRERQDGWVRRDYPALVRGSGVVGVYPFTEGQGERANNLKSSAPAILKPAVFHPLQKVILEGTTREQWKRFNFYQDVAVNFLGFIPLGFFFMLRIRRRSGLSPAAAGTLVLLFGALLSLGIELTQVYLPNRDSQLSDLVCNALGTLIGIVLAWGAERRVQSAER